MFHNDSLLYTSPSSLNNGCTALFLFDRQFAICSVKTEGNKFVFTNLNSPSQSWQLESSAAYSAVLGIVLKLSRNFSKSQSKKYRLSEKMKGRFYYAFISSWKAVYFGFYSGREEILG